MAEVTEGLYFSDVFKTELEQYMSREPVTVLAGSGTARTLVLGEVFGKITKGAAVVAADEGNTGNGAAGAVTLGTKAKVGAYSLECISIADPTAGAAVGAAVAGNTGNGTITAAPTVGAGAKVGVYRAVCIEPATDLGKFTVENPDGVTVGVATVGTEFVGGGLTFTIADGDTDFVSGDSFTITVASVPGNGGVFAVFDPDGYRLADLSVGVAYAGDHINFTLADGTTDFAVGDALTVTVAAGSGKVVALDLTAVNGAQDAAGIMAAGVTAAVGTDAPGVGVVRDASFAPSKLTWPAGITNGQKTAALAQLAALSLIAREEA